MRRALLTSLALIALTGGCARSKICAPVVAAPDRAATLAPGAAVPDWRDAITDPDHIKLRGLRSSFLAGLQQARASGASAALDADTALFDPDQSQDSDGIRPGAYRCTTISLGSRLSGRPAYVADAPRACTITAEGALLRLSEGEGRQRLTGRLYPDAPSRDVFLGTLALEDEASAPRYGRDADRNAIGALERIGPDRWRLALPRPGWEAVILLIEIRPA
ncbi:DUF4893 domain-containing protein [Sphingomonas morindae]|uniref:DUF4893 domain-containing protein n=1 Tax=Sphingomonas morindae TaxID=1541170 RepID=A0ABY4XAN6_9SPHN|nr:DUF4893 domain-containing protein [Sphingomonas morindae]USI74020.1 DUF4893 domain-containing protein [Sphingomonas morindae]